MSIPVKVAAISAAVLLYALPATAQQGWEFLFTPYFLAPNLEGTADLGITGGDISLDPGDLSSQLETGGMITFEARHASNLGGYISYSFMKVEGSDPARSVSSGTFKQRVAEVYVTYRFHDEGRDVLDAYGGLRRWDAQADVVLAGGPAPVAVRRREEWNEPVIGLRWQRRMSRDFRVSLQGDAGGFGAGSDLSWSVMGGLIYDRWSWGSIVVMYRAMGVDYTTGSPGTRSHFRYDVVTHALLAGISLRF